LATFVEPERGAAHRRWRNGALQACAAHLLPNPAVATAISIAQVMNTLACPWSAPDSGVPGQETCSSMPGQKNARPQYAWQQYTRQQYTRQRYARWPDVQQYARQRYARPKLRQLDSRWFTLRSYLCTVLRGS